MNMFRNEVAIMCRIEHPNVVRLLETFEDEIYFYLVMEMIRGGELFDMVSKIKKYSEQDAAKAFGQIVKAIEHMQENKIVHRDLKPENLLLSAPSADSDVKGETKREKRFVSEILTVADFGLAAEVPSGVMLFDAVGTPNYIAPEILLCLEQEPEGEDACF
jgi:serine/threonine protein kinase